MKIYVKKTNQEFEVPDSVQKHFKLPSGSTKLTIHNTTPKVLTFIFDALAQENAAEYVKQNAPQELINLTDAMYVAHHFQLTSLVDALKPHLQKALSFQNISEPNTQLRFPSGFLGDEQNFLHRDFKGVFQ